MYPLTPTELTAIGRTYGLVYTTTETRPFAWRVVTTHRYVVVDWRPVHPHRFHVRLGRIEPRRDPEWLYEGEFVFEPGETSGAEETLRRLLQWAANRGYGDEVVQ